MHVRAHEGMEILTAALSHRNVPDGAKLTRATNAQVDRLIDLYQNGRYGDGALGHAEWEPTSQRITKREAVRRFTAKLKLLDAERLGMTAKSGAAVIADLASRLADAIRDGRKQTADALEASLPQLEKHLAKLDSRALARLYGLDITDRQAVRLQPVVEKERAELTALMRSFLETLQSDQRVRRADVFALFDAMLGECLERRAFERDAYGAVRAETKRALKPGEYEVTRTVSDDALSVSFRFGKSFTDEPRLAQQVIAEEVGQSLIDVADGHDGVVKQRGTIDTARMPRYFDLSEELPQDLFTQWFLEDVIAEELTLTIALEPTGD